MVWEERETEQNFIFEQRRLFAKQGQCRGLREDSPQECPRQNLPLLNKHKGKYISWIRAVLVVEPLFLGNSLLERILQI